MELAVAFMICGLFNIAFLICGYKIAKSKEIITITKGDTVQTLRQYEDWQDEEASYNTPEQELAYEAALKKVNRNGMEA
jgi:hypothetical protein